MAFLRQAALCAVVIGALMVMLLAVAAHAQTDTDNAPAIERFTSARWSLIRPNRDYEGGCVVGFLAFQFSSTGYFSFNNHIRGSWRIDELGNLKLRTRDGISLTLIVDGNTLHSTTTLPFLHRTDLFQRCPE